MGYTAQDLARWMEAKVRERGELPRQDVVSEIERRFGKEFLYENERGGISIKRAVLAAFRKLAGDTVVYSRSAKMWRTRTQSDPKERWMVE